MHHLYLVCILFGMPSLHLFTFLMFFKSFSNYTLKQSMGIYNVKEVSGRMFSEKWILEVRLLVKSVENYSM